MPRIKVCVRTKPTQNFAQENLVIDPVHNSIQVLKKNRTDDNGPNNQQNSFSFRFDHVFHNSAQNEVYDLYARDVVQGVVHGVNGCVLTYGQTGSGKTFTMNGDAQNYEHRGVAPRAICQLFNEVNARIEFDFKLSCSYIEIYNENIFDLLDTLSGPDQVRDYKREKVTEIEITSENEALNVLFTGELARTTATHRLNRKSNRSHSLFTVYVEQRHRSGISEKVVHSKLVLTDLAGSERLKKTMNNEDGYDVADDAIKKESMSINRSLTYLEQCVVALSRKGQFHVPYRQSKLTMILKDCLGANCNTLMIACVWGEAEHLEETISTLRLASRMMHVENETTVMESVDPSALIRKQERLIKALKQELLMHDALVERTEISYDPFTPEQTSGIVNIIERFVDAKEDVEEDILTLTSVRQMMEICKQFKKMLIVTRAEVAIAREEAHNIAMSGGFGGSRGGDRGDPNFSAESNILDDYDPRKQAYVGSLEKNQLGFSLGVAPSGSRPLAPLEIGNSPSKPLPVSHPESKELLKPPISPRYDTLRTDVYSGQYSPIDYNNEDQSVLFDMFVNREGSELQKSFLDSKSLIKDLKVKIRETSVVVNSSKLAIDDLQRKMEVRKDSRIELLKRSGFKASEAADIVDEEELALARDLKETKRSYKSSYEAVQRLKASLASAQENADHAKDALASAFVAWSRTQLGGSHLEPDSMDDTDTLDNQESFERMEKQRILAKHPDSLAFFQAQKTRKTLLNQNGSAIRQTQKNKRLG